MENNTFQRAAEIRSKIEGLQSVLETLKSTLGFSVVDLRAPENQLLRISLGEMSRPNLSPIVERYNEEYVKKMKSVNDTLFLYVRSGVEAKIKEVKSEIDILETEFSQL